MKKNCLAFTLIEILVGVSISVIIMISVGVFVTSGIKNITIQKSILNQESEYISLFQDVSEVFDSRFEVISYSQTGLLVKTEGFKLGKPLLYDFSLQTFTGECLSDINKETKYLQMKNYNPFVLSSGPFTGSYLKHEIYRLGTKVVGKGVFGDNFQELALGKDILLNNPGGVSHSGANFSFFSDTGNNRVMYYSGTKVSSILDFNQGLYQPTGLLYDSLSKNLFVLNSGKKQLLKISSASGTISPIQISEEIKKDLTFDTLSLEVLDNFTLQGTYNTGSFIFSGVSTGTGDSVSLSDNILTYTFSGAQNISSGSTFSLNIPSFTGTFDGYGASYVDIKFYNGGGIVHQKILPYVIHSDNSLLTTLDNNIEILTGALHGYFTDISGSGNLLLKDYINKTQLILSKTGAFISSGSLSGPIQNFETTIKKYDIKIKDMQITQSGGLLSMKIEYYKNFNCDNEEENIVKTFLFKKTLSD